MEKLTHEKQVVLLDMPSLILSIEIYNPISLGDLYFSVWNSTSLYLSKGSLYLVLIIMAT